MADRKHHEKIAKDVQYTLQQSMASSALEFLKPAGESKDQGSGADYLVGTEAVLPDQQTSLAMREKLGDILKQGPKTPVVATPTDTHGEQALTDAIDRQTPKQADR